MGVNKVVYGNNTVMDISDTTATAEDVASGKYFYAANGTKTVGTSPSGSSTGSKTFYGTTSSASQKKTVNCPDFVLETGVHINIKFIEDAYDTKTTHLNINNTGNVPVYVAEEWSDDNIPTTTTQLARQYIFWNTIVEFVYDGNVFWALNKELATTNNYGLVRLSTSVSSNAADRASTPSAVKQAYDLANSKQEPLVSGTNIKTINNQSILGSGNINISGTINSDVEQKHTYNINGQTYYYQFYGVSSIAGIVVNVGVEIDVVYATLVLIMQSIEEMKQGYSNTLAAIQGMHIPDDVYEQPVLIVAIHNLGTMTCYIDESTRYVTRAIFTNFAQGYSVDFGTNPTELTIYYSALNSDDYLSKTNTDTYTPASDYNPATKKYVDDAIADALRNAGIIN